MYQYIWTNIQSCILLMWQKGHCCPWPTIGPSTISIPTWQCDSTKFRRSSLTSFYGPSSCWHSSETVVSLLEPLLSPTAGKRHQQTRVQLQNFIFFVFNKKCPNQNSHSICDLIDAIRVRKTSETKAALLASIDTIATFSSLMDTIIDSMNKNNQMKQQLILIAVEGENLAV